MSIFDLVGTAFLSNYKFFITATIVKKKKKDYMKWLKVRIFLTTIRL